MSRKFEGKVAVVTGASAGIGRATALALAREGARVVIGDVSVGGGEETAQMIRDESGEAIFVRTDVAKSEEIQALIRRAVDEFGGVDLAFNNAGIEGESAPTGESTEDNWNRVIGINLTGVYLSMKYEIPEMLKRGGGAIVNCASVAGMVGFAGIPAYTASKHGVVGLTKTAALEYATAGIRINAVCPGVIATPMIDRFTHGDPKALESMTAMEPVGRLGEPEEVADSVVWLLSDEASFVTGDAIAVDGGFVAR